jgi:hypothetical protein
MDNIANALRQIVESAAIRLREIPERETHPSRVSGEWSPRQVLGHLIDSAANNHQRFVRARFTDDLVFPGYDQEQWVTAQHYQDEAWTGLVELWRLYNLHLAHVIAAIPAEMLTRPRWPHNLDQIAWKPVPAGQPATLEYLVRDYLGHLQAHLDQIFVGASS